MDLNATLNNVVMCFIIPPPQERPHSSWRAICYTKEPPEKVFHGTRNLPTKINPAQELMKQELCDPDHIPAHIVQLTEKDQFVYIEGEVCEVIGTEIHMADGHEDPYLRKCAAPAKPSGAPSSGLVLPGQQSQAASALTRKTIITTSQQAASMGAGGPVDMSDMYIVDLTFKTHEVSDPAIRDHVKQVAWNHGLQL